MTSNLPHTLAVAMLAMAPPSSIVHQIVSEDQALRFDLAGLRDKQSNGYDSRNRSQAVRLEQSLPEALRGVL